MARADDLDSADSQFFICFAPAPYLDGEYTVWGQVVDGMQFVDRIAAGTSENGGIVDVPDRIVRLQVAVDAK